MRALGWMHGLDLLDFLDLSISVSSSAVDVSVSDSPFDFMILIFADIVYSLECRPKHLAISSSIIGKALVP